MYTPPCSGNRIGGGEDPIGILLICYWRLGFLVSCHHPRFVLPPFLTSKRPIACFVTHPCRTPSPASWWPVLAMLICARKPTTSSSITVSTQIPLQIVTRFLHESWQLPESPYLHNSQIAFTHTPLICLFPYAFPGNGSYSSMYHMPICHVLCTTIPYTHMPPKRFFPQAFLGNGSCAVMS